MNNIVDKKNNQIDTEIVRCCDCVFHNKYGACEGGMFDCVNFTEDAVMFTKDSDFCSYGKRIKGV